MRLRLVAEVLANALARKQTEDALRASEAMKSSILHSMRSGVAVVDRDGRVLALNDNWTRLVQESGDLAVSVGENLLEATGVAAEPPARLAELGIGRAVGAAGRARQLRLRVHDPVRQGPALVVGRRRSARASRGWRRRDARRRDRPATRRARRPARPAGAGARRQGLDRRRADGLARARDLSAADGDHDQRPGGAADARRGPSRRRPGAGHPLRHRQRRSARERRHRAAARSASQGRARDGARSTWPRPSATSPISSTARRSSSTCWWRSISRAIRSSCSAIGCSSSR